MSDAAWPERVWVVRHAESVGNAAHVAAQSSGSQTIAVTARDPDIPLSERGTAQAGALGRWFGHEADAPPTTILVSPFRRTRETAAHIAEAAGWPLFGAIETGAPVAGEERPARRLGEHAPIPIVTDERLREKDPGRLEGLTRAGIIARYPAEAEAYGRLGKFYYRPPGGESWCDVILRLRSLVELLRTEYADRRVLIVTHQVVVVCLRYVLEGLDEAGVLALEKPGEVANTSVTSYRRAEGHLGLQTFNSVAHLADEQVAVTAEHPAHTPPVAPEQEVSTMRRDAPETDESTPQAATATARIGIPSTTRQEPVTRDADAPPDGADLAQGQLITRELLGGWALPEPGDDADKEARGRILVIGGDARVPGGALLAATAALRAGAGKLQLAVAAPVAPALGVAIPEALVAALPALPSGALDPEQLAVLEDLCQGAAATVVGPGLVEPDGAAALVRRVVEWLPTSVLIVDAAALAGVDETLGQRLADRLIVTPNATEAAQLLDWDEARIAADPAAAAHTIAGRFRAVVALKGRETQIVDPEGHHYVNRAGNVGLAVSGSGDVLVGVIGGLLARGAAPLQAAAWGVHLHALAADELAEAVGPLGYLPREIPARLPTLLAALAKADGQE
jgi:ADP-dependent NAD(P)H-hydrate dehydratase